MLQTSSCTSPCRWHLRGTMRRRPYGCQGSRHLKRCQNILACNVEIQHPPLRLSLAQSVWLHLPSGAFRSAVHSRHLFMRLPLLVCLLQLESWRLEALNLYKPHKILDTSVLDSCQVFLQAEIVIQEPGASAGHLFKLCSTFLQLPSRIAQLAL